ncbi:pre-mRNA-splicing factor 38B [Xylariales sp. AK1849]|nr:pre-mRNA-splicing factor 38B [Xylariales sp. AK1849]
MAALTPAQIELANSLTQDELPTKLRCAICSKLAVNAFRLPCCETAICENCQSTLPSSCPVCEHSPVSGDDCTMYKSLRTTIRVFLKTEEKKREAARPKVNASAPPTPVEPTPAPIPIVLKAPIEQPPPDAATPAKDGEAIAGTATEQTSAPPEAEAGPSGVLEQAAGTTPNLDDTLPGQSDGHSQDAIGEQALVPTDQDQVDDQQLENANEDAEGGEGNEASGQGTDQEMMMNGNFNGMNFNGGDMSQMQMMMAMQSGMNPAAFGTFPMMGKLHTMSSAGASIKPAIGMGMSMDPMAMQNMYVNGGFGAQGMMNGMSMNMGMNGFNGGNNDWNGQQSWNGQDNFNPNAAGMGNGDYGNMNSGFRAGYNPGNYGHNNQFNDYGRGGYGYRGRGRGRGFYRGYGRGNYNQGYGGPRHQGQEMWAQQTGQNSANNDAQTDGFDATEGTEEVQKNTNTDEFGRTVRADEDGQVEGQNGVHESGSDDKGDGIHESTGQVPTDNAPHPAEAHDDSTMANGDVSADQYARSNGPSYGAGYMPPPAVAPAVPLNAPTGPKAMRQGLPNTSALHLRARGFIQEQSPSVTNASVVASPIQDERPASRSSSLHSRRDPGRRHSERGRDHDLDKEKTRSKDSDRDHDRSRSHSRSRSRSRSRDRKESRRHRRHRSESVSGDDREEENRRHKHKSRRSTRDEDDYKSRSKDAKYEDRSRSASPDRDRDRDREREHRRSGHRSHRERDKEREKDRESDREHRRKSSHRSHHDHDRERRKDRDREHRHRSRKASAEPPTPIQSSEKEFNPPTGPRGSGSNNLSAKETNSKPSVFSIKGASSKSKSSSNNHRRESEVSSSRRASQASIKINAPKSAPSGPAKDPHTLEREARDRERLLKEAQRMAGLAGLGSLKRGRDAGDERGGRRKSRRSEAVYGDEEERMRRTEAEREGGRWD